MAVGLRRPSPLRPAAVCCLMAVDLRRHSRLRPAGDWPARCRALGCIRGDLPRE